MKLTEIIFLFFAFNSFSNEFPLIDAIKKNNLAMIFQLCSHSEHVNEYDGNTTPIHEALKLPINETSFKIVSLLVSNGADLNKRDIRGYTALDYAARKNSLGLAKLFEDENITIQDFPDKRIKQQLIKVNARL